MQKRVLLIGGNYYPEPIGIGKYNGEMIEWLAQNGYECTVITSFPYYPQWKIQQPYLKNSFWYKKETKFCKPFYENSIQIYRCPQYVPDNPSGAKRMLLGLSFFLTSSLIVLKLLTKRKYDIVITVAPSFETGLLAIFYKFFKGGRFLYHIQDLQIDAARDLKMVKSKALLNAMFSIEKYILKKADVISTVSTGMMDKVKGKCNKQVDFFPNWVDAKVIFPITNKGPLKELFNFKSSDKIVLYSGAIGEKQGLENIMLAAKAFTANTQLKFVICGSGPYLNKLETLKETLQLSNVIFMPTQPVEKLNCLLNMADLHLIIQKANASDLVMPSKLTNILAVGGVAIVTALPDSSLFQLVSNNNVGIIAVPEDVESLTKAILKGITDNTNEIGMNALAYAKKHFSIGNIISTYTKNMLENANNVEENYQADKSFYPLRLNP
ncbi:WcaI family glycosyltransferase [Pedobacter immunditicola]|uniref:WcaI family glycosyltransferase n=1 Tax=Pedobacter immunditicola TaxID=3133440 RepID=UPI00309F2792